MTALRWTIGLLLPVALAAGASAQTPSAADKPSQTNESGWKVEIDPLYVWVPIFISTSDIPELPDVPSPPGGASESAIGSLNGAVLAAVRVGRGRFEGRVNLLYAGLSATRDSPRLHVSMDLAYGDAFVGWAVARDLQLEGGVRRISARTSVQFLSYPAMKTKPGLWDPLIGMTYRHPMGRKWILSVHGDGGGFGVGSDVDLSFNAGFDWQAASHFGMTFGYGGAYLRFSHPVLESTSLDKELTIGATLQGPLVALRILF